MKKPEPKVDYFRALDIVGEVAELTGESLDKSLASMCQGSLELEACVRELLSSATGDSSTAPGIERKADVLPNPTRPLGDKYVLHERIGAGSMGEVFRGEHRELGKQVAIKILRAGLLRSAEDSTRLLAEARANAGVRHENVVAVHDVGIADGAPFMVMDWLEGRDLQRWLLHANQREFFQRGWPRDGIREFYESELPGELHGSLWTRPYAEVVATLMMQVARAVHEAHIAGLVHRDIAPKNIIVTGAGRPVLIDFGVAALICADAPASTRGEVAGTMPYMAPEQLGVGPAGREAAVDVYSLGATLYHLLAGRLPFSGEPVSMALRIATELPPDLRGLQREVPAELAAICFAAMEKRREDRYPSAAAFAEDLQAFLERRPVSRKPPRLPGRLWRWCQRKPAQAIAAGLLVALGVASGGLVVHQHREQGRQAKLDHQLAFQQTFLKLPALFTLEPDGQNPGAWAVGEAESRYGGVLQELVRSEPTRPLLRWYLANWASQVGDLPLAKLQVETLRSAGYGSEVFETIAGALLHPDATTRFQLLAPQELPPPRADSAFDQALVGYCAHRWRDYPEAWSRLTEAIGLDPGEWLYRDLRIIPGMEMGDAKVALVDALLVERSLGRPSSRTLHARAISAVLSGDSAQALKTWERALALVPDQHQALSGMGREYLYTGQLQRAQETLTHAANLKPGSWNTKLLLSRCSQEQGDFSGALEIVEAELQKLSDLPRSPESKRRMDMEMHRIELLLDWIAERQVAGDEVAVQRHIRALHRTCEEILAAPEHLKGGQREEMTSLRVLLQGLRGELDPAQALRLQEIQMAGYFAKVGYVSRFIATNVGLLLRGNDGQAPFLADFWLSLDTHNLSPYSRSALLRDVARKTASPIEAGFHAPAPPFEERDN